MLQDLLVGDTIGKDGIVRRPLMDLYSHRGIYPARIRCQMDGPGSPKCAQHAGPVRPGAYHRPACILWLTFQSLQSVVDLFGDIT